MTFLLVGRKYGAFYSCAFKKIVYIRGLYFSRYRFA